MDSQAVFTSLKEHVPSAVAIKASPELDTGAERELHQVPSLELCELRFRRPRERVENSQGPSPPR